MQRKQLTGIIAGVVIVLTSTYIFWPQETPEGGTRFDPAAQTSKLFDKLTSTPQWMANEASNVGNPNVINGHKVPPMPDPVQNNRDITGIDSDHNGIRDDVDRTIATMFGKDANYEDVLNYERAFEKSLANPTRENTRNADNMMDCTAPFATTPYKVAHETLTKLDLLTKITVNTSLRGSVYMKAYAGTGMGTCPKK